MSSVYQTAAQYNGPLHSTPQWAWSVALGQKQVPTTPMATTPSGGKVEPLASPSYTAKAAQYQGPLPSTAAGAWSVALAVNPNTKACRNQANNAAGTAVLKSYTDPKTIGTVATGAVIGAATTAGTLVAGAIAGAGVGALPDLVGDVVLSTVEYNKAYSSCATAANASVNSAGGGASGTGSGGTAGRAMRTAY